MVRPRAKGNIGESDFRRLLQERDWRVFKRPHGESGDDFTAIDTSDRIWSCEVKHTVSLTFQHYVQCRDQSKEKNRLLAWRPSKWGFPAKTYIVLMWPSGGEPEVHKWRARA